MKDERSVLVEPIHRLHSPVNKLSEIINFWGNSVLEPLVKFGSRLISLQVSGRCIRCTHAFVLTRQRWLESEAFIEKSTMYWGAKNKSSRCRWEGGCENSGEEPGQRASWHQEGKQRNQDTEESKTWQRHSAVRSYRHAQRYLPNDGKCWGVRMTNLNVVPS